MGMFVDAKGLFESVDPRFLRLRIARVDTELDCAVDEGRLADARRLAAWQIHLLDCLMYGEVPGQRRAES